jgi:glycosyltransferase involved in cell wall biosynthesis
VPPAVSILMPTFNRLEFLPAAIESVFRQSFRDWELIIADDGSGSDTRAYLRSLAHPRVRVLWLAHSGRPAVMLNTALQTASGGYVAFLDSDDLWQPRKLEIQLASLRRHPARRWGCTGFALINAAGESLTPRGPGCPAPSGWVRERLLTDAIIAMPSVIAVRNLLEQVGPLDEELVMCYDDELWLRLAAASELDGVNEPLTLVRRHGAHGGSDIIAWRDRRRVVEKALRNTDDAHFAAILREQRAVMSAGLARSHSLYGKRIDVVRTLTGSAAYSWRYRQWWSGAFRAAARAFTPRLVRRAVRTLRA